jgi:hypothetical protein
MPLPAVLETIVGFLRAGYPQGVPDRDYLPLFALLRRRLTEDEVSELAHALEAESPDEATTQAIHEAITYLTNETPSETDIERVRARLQAVGFAPV